MDSKSHKSRIDKVLSIPNVNTTLSVAQELLDPKQPGQIKQCLTLDQHFQLKFSECDKKKEVICRIISPEAIPTQPIPRFPCLSRIKTDRKKRSNLLRNTESNEGKLLGVGSIEVILYKIILICFHHFSQLIF